MKSAFIPVTLSLDVSAAGEEAQAVASELLRRTNGLARASLKMRRFASCWST
ncbi:hypothetical protein M2003_000338 [Enterobacter hormaechei]|uniref:hypothetical protein n=1 Tax=Enterobacter hormaechei TaxID=158836 RepID=UPI000B294D5E|nr:hypothetical protein [Enterobacter hormaechei]ELD4170043.1 hypothetical protein [Enterobacter hormaechei]HBN5710271.1 hypothetical protein [Enterobacter hormaechei]